MAERSKALDWNSSKLLTGFRGFESHSLRQINGLLPHACLHHTRPVPRVVALEPYMPPKPRAFVDFMAEHLIPAPMEVRRVRKRTTRT